MNRSFLFSEFYFTRDLTDTRLDISAITATRYCAHFAGTLERTAIFTSPRQPSGSVRSPNAVSSIPYQFTLLLSCAHFISPLSKPKSRRSATICRGTIRDALARSPRTPSESVESGRHDFPKIRARSTLSRVTRAAMNIPRTIFYKVTARN